MKCISKFLVVGALAAVTTLAGCSSQNAYQKAFSDKTAVAGNSHTFEAPADRTLRNVKQALVKQNFNVDRADTTAGLIKACRSLQDPNDSEVSYEISVSAYVTEGLTPNLSDVTLAASQKTVLHTSQHTWWHLLWIFPIFPTGTEYSTVVTKEGDITDPGFYKDFFASIDRALAVAKAAVDAAAAEKAIADAKAAADAKVAAAKAAADAKAKVTAAKAAAAEKAITDAKANTDAKAAADARAASEAIAARVFEIAKAAKDATDGVTPALKP